jgi:hypothetical protein
LHECYVYNVSYNDQNRCTGSFAKVGAAPAPSQSTEADVADQAKQMIRNVVSLCNTLDGLPEERYLTMKMHFYEDITPADWQPQHFKDSTGRKLFMHAFISLNALAPFLVQVINSQCIDSPTMRYRRRKDALPRQAHQAQGRRHEDQKPPSLHAPLHPGRRRRSRGRH